jgi:predicted glycoside hydrolase/deacetylase ChbG (UPF0249 family)
VIINADDLGMSQAVNDAIFGLLDAGRISSSTVLANGPCFEDAAKRVTDYPRYSFGIHLNLTQFRPLTNSRALDPILDEAGSFTPLIRHVAIDSQLARAIFDEWAAQIDLLRSAGVQVSHIDSHHHVHTVPRLLPVLKRIQKAFGIRKIRNTKNLYAPDERLPKSLVWKKRLWSAALRASHGTITTDGFTAFEIFHDVARSNVLPQRTFELMAHPGDPANSGELRLLTGNWQSHLAFETTLISYNDL